MFHPEQQMMSAWTLAINWSMPQPGHDPHDYNAWTINTTTNGRDLSSYVSTRTAIDVEIVYFSMWSREIKDVNIQY